MTAPLGIYRQSGLHASMAESLIVIQHGSYLIAAIGLSSIVAKPFKLTHRDLGPRSRYLGLEVPRDDLIWQDPLSRVNQPLVNAKDIAALKSRILTSGLTVPELVKTAWASAATFRGNDMRSGANGACI